MRARFENNDNRVVFDGPVRLDDRCAEDEARLHEKDAKPDGNMINSNYIEIRLVPDGECVGRIQINERMSEDIGKTDSYTWHEFVGDVNIPDGTHPIYLIYHGSRKIQIKDILFR